MLRGLDKPRKRQHRELRGVMAIYGDTQSDLARAIGRSTNYVSDRMTGRGEWTLEECYQLLHRYNVPPERLHVVFPRRGLAI